MLYSIYADYILNTIYAKYYMLYSIYADYILNTIYAIYYMLYTVYADYIYFGSETFSSKTHT